MFIVGVSLLILLRRRRKRTLLGSTLVLGLPRLLFQRLVGLTLRHSRQFWSAVFVGLSEKTRSATTGRTLVGWEETQYVQHYRVSKNTVWFLSEAFGKLLEKIDTHKFASSALSAHFPFFSLTITSSAVSVDVDVDVNVGSTLTSTSTSRQGHVCDYVKIRVV